MGLTLRETRDFIYEIEKRFPVEEWEINDIKVWPIIRIKLNYYLSYASLGIPVNKSIQSRGKMKLVLQVLSAPLKWLYYSTADIRNNQNVLKKRDLIFVGSPVGFVEMEARWFDKFCDPIIEGLKSHGLNSLRLDTAHKYHHPRNSPSFFFQTVLDFTITTSILTFDFKKVKYQLEDYDGFLNFLEQKNIINDIDLSIEQISKQIYKIQKLKALYNKIIKATKPLAGMTVCYYDDICLAFVLACKQNRVPVFDIQHGVQGENHAAYGNWTKIPKDGYELLPNYFVCWGRAEADSILKWSAGIGTHKPVIMGNMFLESWKLGIFDTLYNDIFHAAFKNNRPKVLITLGWDLADEITLANNIEAILKTGDAYNWLIRLHPAMIHQKAEVSAMLWKHGINNFEIDLSSQLPLYYILRNINCHITHSSTCTIEAAESCVPTLITSEYGWELFKDNADIAMYVHQTISGDDIVECLNKLSNNELLDKKNHSFDDTTSKNKIFSLIELIKGH